MLEKIVRDENIEHIILAGDEETVIPLLREQMPKTIEEKVIDALSLGYRHARARVARRVADGVSPARFAD